MSVFASTASDVFTEDRLFDECSDPTMSMQPSDEWESQCVNTESQFDGEVSPEREQDGINVDDSHSIVEPTPYRVEQSNTTTDNTTQYSRQSVMMDKSYDLSNQSFVSYLSHLVPIKMMNMDMSMSMSYGTSSPETHAKAEALTEQKLKTQKAGSSSHSRCIIENTESIKDRRDDHKQYRAGRGEGEGEDCTRDQNQNHHHHHDSSVMSCSVEEISQISELTMDIHTVVPEPAEHKFASCATLPTISEVKRFESTQIASCTAGALSIKHKARCSGEPNSTKCADKCDKNSRNSNDMIDFVFELVEDALCTPVTGSKAERKKFFMEAFQEESEKAIKIKTASKHSRSNNNNNTSTKSRRGSSRSRSRPRHTTAQTVNNTKSSTDPTGGKTSRSEESMSDEISRVFMVDKSPDQTPELILPKTNAPVGEDQTLDWSKMMSLAEKQLEAEEEVRSIISSFSSGIMATRTASSSEKKKIVVATSKAEDNNGTSSQKLDQQDGDDTAASSLSNSSRTHTTVASDVVRELRELSAFDSSSFDEEETPRFLLTSLLFGFMRRLVDKKSDDQEQKHEQEQEQEVVDELYENCSSRAIEDTVLSKNTTNHLLYTGPPREEFSDERMVIKTFRYIVFTQRIIFQAIRYILFIVYFIFWPSGIPRRKIKNQPLKRRSKEPSLLELVCKN
jgi:hypothetical protein